MPKIENKTSIAILMATYNGAAFVEEQVRSIIQQTFTNWRLLIHDDGSIDATMDILHRLAEEFQQTDILQILHLIKITLVIIFYT